ncbi:hypothetical protein ADIS_2315 [Lunatimonas lonarensis]|uniref:Uncharacterized protein n=1 Tax=Lunatimonas lonarensis TaxID=1232681 RepID=R7ZSX0_9BACT|nr:hypothetical protein ADIS_2315 [Lunatimonas lonarensis]
MFRKVRFLTLGENVVKRLKLTEKIMTLIMDLGIFIRLNDTAS